MAGTWRLSITEGFCASHQLRHYQGKCEQLHGHNFGVEVQVEGSVLDPQVELLLDFGELKRLTREVLSELDHTHLNDLPAFASQNPSSENLARHIFRRLAPFLAELAPQARLAGVSVSEKGTSRATYWED